MGCRRARNEYIDLHDVVWDKDVEALISSLRENGIEYFTFSSTMVECGGNRLALYRKRLHLGRAG